MRFQVHHYPQPLMLLQFVIYEAVEDKCSRFASNLSLGDSWRVGKATSANKCLHSSQELLQEIRKSSSQLSKFTKYLVRGKSV